MDFVEKDAEIEDVADGEFEGGQANKGQTLLTGTPVPSTFADGR